MRRIILGIAMIVFVGAAVAGGTGAFFSDEESSTGNTFSAGAIDLTVDSVAHYNGLVCFDGQWIPDDQVEWNGDDEVLELADDANVDQAIEDYNNEFPSNVPQAGVDCNGTWELTDLGPTYQFFNYGDLKPGDHGENTISLHLETNDGWACAIIDNLEDNENGIVEPEAEDGDVTEDEGELSSELRFFAWSDDGDNIWEEGEIVLFSNTEGPASDVIGGVSYPLFTPDTGTGPMVPGETGYIGMYWCYGAITVDEDNNILSCDGSEVTNLTQTDSMTADITFYVEQSRNNGDFVCPDPENDQEQGRPVGAALAEYEVPTLETCDAIVTDSESIQEALDTEVSEGEVVCVDSSYDRTGDNTAIRMETAGVTLAALVQGILLDVPVVLSADGVTVTGFEGTIGQAESPAEQAAFYFDGDATNASLTFSEVDGGVGAAVLTETGATLGGSLIENNVLSGATQGIYTNPHTGSIMIRYNDIDNNAAGIAGLMGAIVVANEFEHTTPGSEAIGIDSSFDANTASITQNNFLDDTRLNTYGTVVATIVATENFWSPNGGALQTDDNGGTNTIDFSSEAGVQFPHN